MLVKRNLFQYKMVLCIKGLYKIVDLFSMDNIELFTFLF